MTKAMITTIKVTKQTARTLKRIKMIKPADNSINDTIKWLIKHWENWEKN